MGGDPDGSDGTDRGIDYWNARYGAQECVFGDEPIRTLTQVPDLLPARGRALDLAGGEGRNALFLAQRGLDVAVWDFSASALAKARERAARLRVTIETVLVDLEGCTLPAAAFDLIVCSYYTQRSLWPAMAGALAPSGLLVVESTVMESVPPDADPARSRFLLVPNELLRAFSSLRVLFYQERVVPQGVCAGKCVACLVARRESPRPDPEAPLTARSSPIEDRRRT